MRVAFTTLTLLLSMTAVASAQAPRSIPAGTRVRVTIADSIVTGQLVTSNDSTISILNGRRTIDISTSRIERLEVSAGIDRGVSARKGGLIGLFAGGVIGYAAGEDCTSADFICFDRPTTALAGAAVGTGIGALVGFMGGVERWRDAGMPVGLSIAPSGRSVSIASTLRF